MTRFCGLFILISPCLLAQQIGPYLPGSILPDEKFLFYFHGAVVTAYGDNAVSRGAPEWGPYEYSRILDSLRKQGFHVISERRLPGIPDSAYVLKLIAQIDTLLSAGVRASHILVIGASAGWNIVMHASARLRNTALHFVIMGGCWPDTHREYGRIEPYGNFLSIIEASDPHGPCMKLFENRVHVRHREIRLNTGLSHGFIYKGYPQWINPVVQWFGTGN